MKIVFFLFFLFRGFWVLAQTDLEPLPLHTITPSADRNYTIRYRPHFGVTFVNHRLGLSGSEMRSTICLTFISPPGVCRR